MMAEALGISDCALGRWMERQQSPSPGHGRGRRCVIGPEATARIRDCYTAHFGQWGRRVLAAWCRREGLGDWSAGTVAAVIADLREEEEERYHEMSEDKYQRHCFPTAHPAMQEPDRLFRDISVPDQKIL